METMPLTESMTRHIRTKEFRQDKRRRWSARKWTKVNANAPTLCGAAGSFDDTDRDGATHETDCAARFPQLSHWGRDLCPECVRIMREKA